MNELLSALDENAQGLLKRAAFPMWIPPMLAVLSKEVFSDPRWIYEAKLDGQRSLLFKKGNRVRLMTRNEKDRTSHYPDLLEACMASGAPDLIADGEIVAFEGDKTSFSRLQDRMQNSRPSAVQVKQLPVYLYLFDLLWFDGYDLTRLPLRARKQVLRGALSFDDPLRFSDHLEQEGEAAYREACKKGWEGLIAKRADAPYTKGRSRDWLKFKCVYEQEFVVIGWTDPQGARTGIGALLVGYNVDGALRYAGKVGTGYSQRELEMLRAKLGRIERASSPVGAVKGLPRKGIHWVTPKHVAQIGFSEWTDDGKLRHPRYIGLRDDKDPQAIVREQL